MPIKLQINTYLRRAYFFVFCTLGFTISLTAQFPNQDNGGQISGNFQFNGNFFERDSLIGAANTPQYDRQLYGADAWLNLAYSNWGFDFGFRFDMFNNSNLLNPLDSYTDEGVGRWFIKKKINKLGITAGYIYDQIGSGLIFRAFEERPLLIDNALYGIRLTYDLGEDWIIKGFTGRQKQQFDTYASIIKGVSAEGFLSFETQPARKFWSLAPGIGIVNRTLDDNSMDNVVATLNTYASADAFVPKYNTYAFSLYNTLTAGKFSWYLETAYKTEDILNDPFGTFVTDSTTITGDKFIGEAGTVLYSSIGYADQGFAASAEFRRTEYFSFRTQPQAQLNQGLVNFLQPLTRINTYRLTSRYSPAPQELGELAFQTDLTFVPSKPLKIDLNFSNVTDLNNELLYREIYANAVYKYKRKWQLTGGIQIQSYNQEVYEFKPDVPLVETITPFAEFQYKIDRKRAYRVELQYMNVGDDKKAGAKQDYGDWAFALVEFSIAPHWTFTASDMYNVNPGKNSPQDENGNRLSIHYPRFDVYYTHKSNRFSLSYVKQVEGIVCAGGICRLEPAFSGAKLTVNSSF